MNNSPVGWPGSVQPPQNAGSGWQRSSHGNSGYGWAAWPRHSRLKPSPGSRLLSGAEGWWDASVYSDSSRVWRNLGTAGPCANFTRNTANPFIYLTPETQDYLYFLGKNNANEFLQCTAPVDAVSYIAYDVSNTSISGAVTGGATFTFESAGRWVKVSLLDINTAVVAEFVTNDTESFGYTDNYGVAWTISYNSTVSNYVRPSIVRSIEKGGLPFFNMGAKNDNVSSRWECTTAGGTFDITSGNNMTVFAVVRHFAQAGVYGDYLAWSLKYPNGSDATNPRWSLSVAFPSTGQWSYGGAVGICNGLTTNVVNWSADLSTGRNTLGKRILLAMVVNSQGRAVNIYINSTPYGQTTSATTTKGMQGVAGGGFLQTGGNSGNSSWAACFELYATGFFRRALTAAELQTIADHYGCE